MKPRALLDIGPATAPASAPRWADRRREVIARQDGACAACGDRPLRADRQPALDVIPAGDGFAGYCRADRMRVTAAARARKAAATRALGEQRRLPGVLRRRVSGTTLVRAALRRLGPEASAEDGARSMLETMQRRRLLAPEVTGT